MKKQVKQLLDELLSKIPTDRGEQFVLSTDNELLIIEEDEILLQPRIKLFFNREKSILAKDSFTGFLEVAGYLIDHDNETLWVDIDADAYDILTTAFIIHSWYLEDKVFEEEMGPETLSLPFFKQISKYDEIGCISICLTDYHS